MEYLVTACNEIYKIVLGTVEPSDEELERVSALACNTLKQLAKDEDFLKAFDELAKRREENPEAFEVITQLKHFVEGFQVIESDVLKKAGLSDEGIKSLLNKATDLLERIKKPTLKKEELLSQITSLRDEACDIAATLHQKRQEAEEKKKLIGKLIRYGYAIGGAAMIFADASAWAVSIGLSTAGSAVSGAAGTALITYGLTPQ